MQTASKIIHIAFSLIADGPCLAYLYENPTIVTTAGTFTAVNMPRDMAQFNSSSIMMYSTVTINTAAKGTLLATDYIAGNTAGGVGVSASGAIGGEARSASEWNFAENSVYMLEIINASNTTMNIMLDSEFYEEG